MEKVLGPIDGYYAAICARELDGRFRVSYKVCAVPPADYVSARALRQRRVAGPSDTLGEAMELAEQLARLQIARLRDEKESMSASQPPAVGALDFDTSIGDDTPVQQLGRLFAPTEPAPLLMAAQPTHLYASTEPMPLYAATEPAALYAATEPSPLR
jgi:hypothetical protein